MLQIPKKQNTLTVGFFFFHIDSLQECWKRRISIERKRGQLHPHKSDYNNKI